MLHRSNGASLVYFVQRLAEPSTSRGTKTAKKKNHASISFFSCFVHWQVTIIDSHPVEIFISDSRV